PADFWCFSYFLRVYTQPPAPATGEPKEFRQLHGRYN
ncbi:MAG: hypothetical protein ACI82H_002353, partial [Alphaproteobacteria bacterium]